jgi:fluoride exporter
MRRAIAVFLGGGVGASARALVLIWLTPLGSLSPVLLVNLVGAFALGVVFVLADDAGLLRAETRLFVAVGVLGGFTTFSTFAWGADVVFGADHPAVAVVYVLASAAGGTVATVLGLVAGREIVAVLERTATAVLVRLDGRPQRVEDVADDMSSIETENREDVSGGARHEA